MAKVVKAAVIGALVGLTAGLILPAIGLTAPFAAGTWGITSVALASAAGTAFYAGLGALASYFIKKPKGNMSTAGDRLNISIDPQALGKIVFGETAAATDVVYAENHGDKDEYVTYIIAAASHTVESFEDLYITDENIGFSGNAAIGDWADALWRQTNLGTESQIALGGISVDGLSWPGSAKGLGMAHYLLRFKLGTDKTKSIPTRITQVVKGCPVYDPRLDTTVGGSGSHRANDQTTWEYNDGTTDIGQNWALIVLTYLIGWKANGILVWGMGVNPDDIDYDQAIAAANICEETVDSKRRFIINGIFEASNNHEEVIGQLEAAIGGSVAKINGKYYIWAPNDDISTASGIITDTDIVRDAGIEFVPSGPIEDLFNTARGRYISPDDLYQAVYYPDVVESTAVTEDGRARVLDRDFSLIQDVSVAERVARMQVRRSRFSGVWRFSMGPKALIFRPFDVTTINIQETNNLTITVRILNMVLHPAGVVQVECIEEDSSIYDTSLALGTPITQLDPSALDRTTVLDVTNFVVTAVTITGSAGTSRIAYKGAWDDPGPIREFTEAQIKVSTDSEWSQMPATSFGENSVLVTDFEPLTVYDFRVRHVSIFGVPGTWFTLQDTSGDVGLTYYDDIVHYYYQSAPPSGQGEKDNDVWVDSDDNMVYRRISSAWVEAQDHDIGQALIDAAEALTEANGKIQSFYQTAAPSGQGEAEGDFWIDTDDGQKMYRYTSGVWVEAQDDLIGTAINDAADAQATADGKVVTFAQTTAPTAEGVGDFWIDTDDGNRLYRWNGSSWIDYQDDDAATGAAHAAATGNPHSTQLIQIAGDLSDINDGGGYFKSTSAQNTGGTRAVNALDSSFDYIRAISTQKIVISASNPSTGVVYDADGIRGYDSGAQILDIDITGTPLFEWAGDIDTDGRLLATGSTTSGGATAAIIAVPTGSGVDGISASITSATTNSKAIIGVAVTGSGNTGVWGQGSGASTSGITAAAIDASAVAFRTQHSGGGTGILLSAPIITGDADFEDDVIVELTLDVEKSVFLCSDGTAGTNVVVGAGTNTGNQNVILRAGAAGSKTANQIGIYCDTSPGSATLGIVADEAPVSSISFTMSHYWEIVINNGVYRLQLDAV